MINVGFSSSHEDSDTDNNVVEDKNCDQYRKRWLLY